MTPSFLLPSILALHIAVAAEPTIRVLLFDEVNLDAQSREAFRTKAMEILNRAGVASTWLDCPPRTSPETPDRCAEEFNESDFVIRILPRLMIGNDLALGSSVAGQGGGVYGLIYYPNVERTARLVEVSTPMMLALATVHEIGHLILGSQAHWPAGIMHPRWDQKAVAEMVQMNRFFNKSQSRQLQQRLLRRLASR